TRPQLNPIGPLWAWSLIFGLVENLPAVYPTSKAAVTIRILLGGTGGVTGGGLILAYPTGNVPNGWARRWVIVADGTGLWNLPWVLYLQPSFLYVGPAPFDLLTYNKVSVFVWVLPILITVWLLYAQRLRSLSPGARRTVAPILIAGLIYTPFLAYLLVEL